MIKNLYVYVILALTGLYYFLSRYYTSNLIEGYRDAKVYIGPSPIPRNDLLFLDDKSFGWHSVYEVGNIKNPEENVKEIHADNVYGSSYGGIYGGTYGNYYNYS